MIGQTQQEIALSIIFLLPGQEEWSKKRSKGEEVR